MGDAIDPPRLVVVAPTFYSDSSDIRYLLGLESCRKAVEFEIDFILIDASPCQTIRDGLEQAGRSHDGRSFVRVLPQTNKGKKGTALREAIACAVEQLHGSGHENNDDTNKGKKSSMIGFQELEKVDLIRHWKSIAIHAMESSSDIVVPRRIDEYFRASYPIEQYHSENFANMFFDSLGGKIGFPSIDWTNGPVTLNSSMADAWLEYDGELWDAQLVPLVECFVKRNAKVTSFSIQYLHPKSMKEQEEGDPVFNEKRLYQINLLTDSVGKRMKEAAAAAAMTK